MELKLIKVEEKSDSERLQEALDRIKILSLQEGYMYSDKFKLDCRNAGICEDCGVAPVYRKNSCQWCDLDLRGEL